MTKLTSSTGRALPFTVQLNELTPDRFIDYYQSDRQFIDNMLLVSGAVKFSGVEINTPTVFEHIVHSISNKFLNYVDGNSPRVKLSDSVYTSTEYDQSQVITMHNELSYSAKWPNKLFFTCLTPAESGGETLLADSREILQAMNKDIVDEIEARGLLYIRNLHGGDGMGPSWQDTFETTDKQELETYCKKHNISFEWTDQDSLRLKQSARGIISHRSTGEKVWFNQADQFHPLHLGREMVEVLELMYGTPEYFPMYVSYGDGKEISVDTVQEILQTIAGVTLAPVWKKNELLVIDNELAAHGRNPFTGDRKVLVAMTE
ncbi:TauD/TfdA family dioxygenase [Pedobacter cryoconitis]|uniref:TfdA family taurine catabolism dioxygenase TauD n=1 Tax=Pedobacter cryoconitis TaxID=188932 RepID=A0A327SDT2_9SPHI|nr:TauD/TfdA family dioxygenase [Pedobacter cryoconitis]RAJ26898.1 TfdA family taurine catabolism dioxygenase TauD [Pedobacter cryoconitis]